MSNRSTMINDLTSGNLTRQLITFSIPFMLSNLLQSLYSIIDMVVVGQFVGSAGLSAVSVGSQVISFFTWLGIGFSTAGQIMIGQYIGVHDTRGIERTIGTLFTLLLGGAVVLGIGGIALTTPVLQLMNTPAEAFADAQDYMRTCCAGMVFIFGYNAVSSILRGMGESRRPFLFIAIAAVTNLVLDLLFVAVFHWSVFGAALATVIGQAVSFIISIIYLYRRRDEFGFDFKPASFRPHPATAANLTRLGAPMALQSAAISISCMFTTAFVNTYGVAASAITGVGSKISDLSNVVTRAFSNAGSTVVAQNVGAKKYDRVKQYVRVSFILCMATMAVFCIVCGLFPEEVVRLFDSDPETLALAPRFMVTQIVGFIANGLMSPYYAVINGIGYASLSFVIGILDGVVGRIGLSLLLGNVLHMGLDGYWYGMQLAGYVTAFCSAAYYYSGRWKTHKLLIEH